MTGIPAAAAVSPRAPGALARLLRHPGAAIGGGIALFFVLIAILAPVLAPYDPMAVDWMALRSPPSAAHWFGTDEIGRDVLSRTIWGSRASLLAGLASIALALAVGVPLGLAAGYFGGWFDALAMRVVDGMLAIPLLVLAIAMAATLGPSLGNAMIAIGLSVCPVFVRLARAQTLAAMAEEYVEAARAMGYSHLRVALRHVLPNTVPALLVQATLGIATAIITESSLSFLGLGQQPPAPSWGSSLNTAKNFIVQAPWMSLWPGLAICLAVFGFNLLGDGLRDTLDPRDKD
ncbi:MAG: ABC transporter permease [Azospirillum sp.]|nr:ABC transporter permease [Azospirillum sp.]MCA3266293.1 ABC transporter permease [Azospirillum sp.]MCZ8123418.1 ABC transporter permease [Magnetospirillum sp.]